MREDTFSLFCQFAYTGDFETTSCTLEELVESNQVIPDPEAPADTIAEPVSGEEPAQPDESRWDIWRGPNQKSKQPPSKKASLQNSSRRKTIVPPFPDSSSWTLAPFELIMRRTKIS